MGEMLLYNTGRSLKSMTPLVDSELHYVSLNVAINLPLRSDTSSTVDEVLRWQN